MERFFLKVAVYALLIKDGQILLLRRFNTGWQDGNYGLPAGHLEKSETLIAAVMREAKEEVGVILQPENLKIVHTMHRMSEDHNYLDFFFTAGSYEGEPKNMEPNACDDIKWFPLDKLPSNIVPSVKFALEQYRNGIAFSEQECEK